MRTKQDELVFVVYLMGGFSCFLVGLIDWGLGGGTVRHAIGVGALGLALQHTLIVIGWAMAAWKRP